jgi:hypothetical protein
MSLHGFADLTGSNGVTYQSQLGLFIKNEWVEAKSGSKTTTTNPA